MVHILVTGASGSGTTTVGRALAARLDRDHVDTDDLFWLPTVPPFRHRRDRDERSVLLQARLSGPRKAVVSGAIEGWDEIRVPWPEECSGLGNRIAMLLAQVPHPVPHGVQVVGLAEVPERHREVEHEPRAAHEMPRVAVVDGAVVAVEVEEPAARIEGARRVER